MRKFTLTMMGVVAAGAMAAVPEGYYRGLDGKSGEALRDAVASTAAGHKVVEYGEPTWEAFLTTDVIEVGTPLSYRQAWRDMYSNALVYIDQGHPGMNIEHSVPNSWWGGIKNDAYKDLFHLNPSNSTANNQKSNYPLGMVSDIYWTNGITTLGAPLSGFGGGASRVFEPADEYKGDFARAYFYVFTAYDRMKGEDGSIAWKADYDWMYDITDPLGVRPWAADLMLEWAANDPVDQTELDRNEAIYGIQNCRNPFIDFPELAEYIYGDKTADEFDLAAAKTAVAYNRPPAPGLYDFEMTGLNTYAGRWWDTMTIQAGLLDGIAERLEVSIDGLPWEEISGECIEIGHAAAEGETLTIRFRASWEHDGLLLHSPVTFLTLTAKNPENKDLKDSIWQLAGGINNEEDTYIIVAPSVGAVMSSSIPKTFFEVAGYVTPVEVNGESYIKGVPEGTALVRGKDVDYEIGGPNRECFVCRIEVSDLAGNVLGEMAPTAAKNMRLTSEGADCFIQRTYNSDTEEWSPYSFFFGDYGSLQYNASSPRFLNYTSKQTEITTYRLTDLTEIPGNSAVEGIQISSIRVEGRDIIVPVGVIVYDLQGRIVNPHGMAAGVYIAGGRKLIVK